MNKLQLIPEPQEIKITQKAFPLPPNEWRVFCDKTNRANIETVFGSIDIQNIFVENKEDADLCIEICPELSFSDKMRNDVRDQAYKLAIDNRGIKLQSCSENGLFYGLQTLRQIWEQSNAQLPCLNITDWPNMPFRGVHLNLSEENSPAFEKLKDLLSNMSRCKINQFTLEYDDRFPFEKHPVLVHEKALTKDQIKELIKHAKKHYIEIIPLLDSLGHAQPYLVHDEYQHLAELPGNTHEMCPSNPETIKFMKELWSEVLELHNDCEFVHITGDEVFRLGDFCPECKKYAEENRLSELFFSYYKDLSEWMLERGKRPIMWADIALKYPDGASVMPREVIFNDWEYRGSSSEWSVTRILKDPGMTIDHANMDDIPAENREYFKKYYYEEGGTTFKPYPGIAILKDYGFEVIGASSASTESGKSAVPPFSIAVNNNRYISKAVGENNALGVLNTYWSLFRSSIALKNGFWTGDITNAMHGIWAGGAYNWKFVEESNEKFLNKCQQVFMNSDTGEFAKYAALIDSVDLADPGPVLPISEEMCPDVLDLALPSCQSSGDPIVEGYLKGLKDNAISVTQKFQSTASMDAEKRVKIGAGEDSYIDFRKSMNTNHSSVIHVSGRNFSPMGHGEKISRGVTFNVVNPSENSDKSALGLRGAHMPDWAESVEINVDENYDRLFFLNSCAYAKRGEELATCEIHYNDGTTCEHKFILGENLSDWHQGNFNIPAGAPAFAWYGYGDAGPIHSSYMNWWANPYPEKKISHLNLHTGSGDGYIFFFAITGRKSVSA